MLFVSEPEEHFVTTTKRGGLNQNDQQSPARRDEIKRMNTHFQQGSVYNTGSVKE